MLLSTLSIKNLYYCTKYTIVDIYNTSDAGVLVSGKCAIT